MNEFNKITNTAKTSEIYNSEMPKRLIGLGLCEEKIKMVEDDMLSELASYFSYVCDPNLHKPYIPANLIIRAETAAEAVSFAKWLIQTEEEKKSKKISVIERKENDLTSVTFRKLSVISEETILLIKDLKDEAKAPTDVRSKVKEDKALANRWEQYGKIIREGRNPNTKIIVCSSYECARKRFDECSDKTLKTGLKTLFAYDIKLKCKDPSAVTEELIGRLGRRFSMTSVFKNRLYGYNKKNYPGSILKGSDYIDNLINKIIKEKYSRSLSAPVLTGDIISALSLPKTDAPSRESSLSAVNSLTGLVNVKKLLKELEGLCRIDSAQAKEMYLNFVFTGNPGTGKTTVARMMADILCSMGVLKNNKIVEIMPQQLIGQYIGDVELCVKDVCRKACGGILFIDEAYGLDPKNASNNLKAYKEDALACLLKAMEKNRENLTVIFAGYGPEMRRMLEANPGLKSRIYKTVEFEDYSEAELLEIFKAECDKASYSYNEAVLKKAGEKLHILKYDDSFGNARTVKTVFQEACLAHLEAEPSMRERVLKPEYIVIDSKLPDFESNRKKLEGLIGLETVKKNIDEISALCRYNLRTGKNSVPSVSNMLFRGNPGTGKTTVAKLFGNMLFALGAVKAPRFVSINAYELYTSEVGGVSKRLRAYCQKAMGGVLFIDEAYGIGEFVGSTASEAVSVLLDMMENYRDDLVIILAGYTDKMNEFFETNPGLRSRVPVTLEFEDYSLDELEDIFVSLCERNGFTVTDEAIAIVRETLTEAMGKDDFANARAVRNIFEKAYRNHAVRFVENICDDENVLNEEDMDMEGIKDGSYVPMGFS